MFRPLLTLVLTLFVVGATPSAPVVGLDQATRTATPQVPAVAPTTTLPKDPDSIKFLVIGDSGTGDRPQYEVAAKIAAALRAIPVRVRDHAGRQHVRQRAGD